MHQKKNSGQITKNSGQITKKTQGQAKKTQVDDQKTQGLDQLLINEYSPGRPKKKPGLMYQT